MYCKFSADFRRGRNIKYMDHCVHSLTQVGRLRMIAHIIGTFEVKNEMTVDKLHVMSVLVKLCSLRY